MKKLFSIIISLAMFLTLIACGGTKTSDDYDSMDDDDTSVSTISATEKAYRESCMPISDVANVYDLFVYNSGEYSGNDKYVGKAMFLEGKVLFSIEWDGDKAYMFVTLNELGGSLAEYLIVDKRENSSLELKKNDLITVYGDYIGVVPARDDMFTFVAVVPRFDMFYMERNK